jgi:formate dehydrogenase subunit gamma
MSEARIIERFKKRTIWLHWIHTLSFIALIVTGAILLVPGLGEAAAGGVTRIVHRVGIVIFVGIPVIYAIFNPRTTWHFIKESLTWGKGDIGWLLAAPSYYFGGPEDKMPPQEHINTGQKMWQFIILATGILFLASGFIMLFLKDIVAPAVFEWSVVAHDVAFILAFLMLLVHIYTGAIHPRMTESFKSMIDGKVSSDYAKHHYGKWYDKIAAKNK